MDKMLALVERDLRRFRRSPTLIFVSMVAKEKHLAAVGHQDQRIMGKGHGVVSSV